MQGIGLSRNLGERLLIISYMKSCCYIYILIRIYLFRNILRFETLNIISILCHVVAWDAENHFGIIFVLAKLIYASECDTNFDLREVPALQEIPSFAIVPT